MLLPRRGLISCEGGFVAAARYAFKYHCERTTMSIYRKIRVCAMNRHAVMYYCITGLKRYRYFIEKVVGRIVGDPL